MTLTIRFISRWSLVALFALSFLVLPRVQGSDRLVFQGGPGLGQGKHIVLIGGDEEYRTEESMPMLGKILSQRHGFRCTVLFSMSPGDGTYIDPHNHRGLGDFSLLKKADLVIIGTRFRTPNEAQAEEITEYLNAGKPLIGIRTSTHAFQGSETFGGAFSYGQFGRKILGEQWISHHGIHKQQGARSVVEQDNKDHSILNGVGTIDAPSDVYGVIHLTDDDQILLRAAVTTSLDPNAPLLDGPKNDPMQPFAWLHTYTSPDGKKTGQSFCTTAGASVDFLDEDLRRLVVNASFDLLGISVPKQTNVEFVDPFYPSFYGFIQTQDYWKQTHLTPADFDLGKAPAMPDPPGSPHWPRPRPEPSTDAVIVPLNIDAEQRIALVGNSTAERMSQFGHFEAMLHSRFADKQLRVRNFGWPADEVGVQQRPGNYNLLDDPLQVFSPDLFVCFFGFNESYAGTQPKVLDKFVAQYRHWIHTKIQQYTKEGKKPRFVLVSPIAFESTGNDLQPKGDVENKSLEVYAKVIAELAATDGHRYIDVFSQTRSLFASQPGSQYTINGVHLNEKGDRELSQILDQALFGEPSKPDLDTPQFEKIRAAVNDKSWYHLQDYRMLNGWYVYGGRRTHDTETFPVEYKKIRKMVDVRDRYIWALAKGEPVPDKPDDSETGEVFIPETLFGTRDEGFRKWREPESLQYPTPEESIAQMTVPEGFQVQTFASEREFPELANPTQIEFDNQGRLWVSCMVNYPQWLPGSAKPGDHLLILEDNDHDGKADECKVFYDKLICPTGFEFWNGGVLVVDEPRILFLKDTDGDDKADQVVQILDGIGTDDTHHAMGAWEYSHGGLLHMLEGVAMSTTLETPWGPVRNHGPSGSYVFDPVTLKIRYFQTPAHGNPWLLVFDSWGNGVIGDGTMGTTHWTSPLSGKRVPSRRTLKPVFNNQGMRPAVGNEFLWSRHFPDNVQGQMIYGCVINMHGFPRFTVKDEEKGAGLTGTRVEDLISSTDRFFRPVDPEIGPDGALWFGDWCNALIGHMQYSQRDPNRDHEHGRIYRLVNKNRPLLTPTTQAGKSIPELLDQLVAHELRTRYRARRELRDRPRDQVLAAVAQWITPTDDPQKLCEAMWIQEGFRSVDPDLLNRILECDDFRARSAAIHTIGNEVERLDDIYDWLVRGAADEHPRVRLEAVRACSFLPTKKAAKIALTVKLKPDDYWVDYTLEHTLQALDPAIQQSWSEGTFLSDASPELKSAYKNFKYSTGPGKAIFQPLKKVDNPDLPEPERQKALQELVQAAGGSEKNGKVVFSRACAACHIADGIGKAFGPDLSNIALSSTRQELIESIVWPNQKIAKGFETVTILTVNGKTHTGFILEETPEEIRLGVADSTGKAKVVIIADGDIEEKIAKNASSMPDGLIHTMAPIEFLDLLRFLEKGWVSVVDPDPAPLRELDGYAEISRNARLRIGSDFPAVWNGNPTRFLNTKPPRFDFSIHSNEGAIDSAFVIDLEKEHTVRRIWIKNRLASEFYSRAKGLTVWLSIDGKTWSKAWQATKTPAEWTIKLPDDSKARYVKIGIPGSGTINLYKAAVFGE